MCKLNEGVTCDEQDDDRLRIVVEIAATVDVDSEIAKLNAEGMVDGHGNWVVY